MPIAHQARMIGQKPFTNSLAFACLKKDVNEEGAQRNENGAEREQQYNYRDDRLGGIVIHDRLGAWEILFLRQR